MQPLASATVRRPFSWGIVVLSAPGSTAPMPEAIGTQPVSANDDAIVVLVQHADDGEAEVHLRQLSGPPPPDPTRRELYRGRLRTPAGTVASDVPLDDLSPDAIRVDLLPTVAPWT